MLFRIDCERSEPIAAEGRRYQRSEATWACPGITEPKAIARQEPRSRSGETMDGRGKRQRRGFHSGGRCQLGGI